MSIWASNPVLAGLNPEMYFHAVFNLEMSYIWEEKLREPFLSVQLNNSDILAFLSIINHSVVLAVPFHVWGFLSTILVHDWYHCQHCPTHLDAFCLLIHAFLHFSAWEKRGACSPLPDKIEAFLATLSTKLVYNSQHCPHWPILMHTAPLLPAITYLFLHFSAW